MGRPVGWVKWLLELPTPGDHPSPIVLSDMISSSIDISSFENKDVDIDNRKLPQTHGLSQLNFDLQLEAIFKYSAAFSFTSNFLITIFKEFANYISCF